MLSINLENHVAARRVISAALEIDHINHSTQYAHVYYNGRAFATISARRVLATGKRWTVTDTTGALLFEANFQIEFANDAFRRRLISIIQDMERPDREPTKSEIAARAADEMGLPVIDMPVSEVAPADLAGMPELIQLAERAAAPATSICSYAELTGYEQTELAFRGWPRGEGVRYEVKRKYDQDARESSLVRFISPASANPARAALTRAVNASIAAGSPVFVNQPASQPAPEYLEINGKRFARSETDFVESLFQSGGTCAGFFVPRGHEIELQNMQGEKIAVINREGVLCCATKLDDGRFWYSHATVKEIGRYESYAQGRAELTGAIAKYCRT